MFFFINYVLSLVLWLLIAYLFDFSILGWIIGLIISWLYKEFIGPMIIIAVGEKTIKENDNN